MFLVKENHDETTKFIVPRIFSEIVIRNSPKLFSSVYKVVPVKAILEVMSFAGQVVPVARLPRVVRRVGEQAGDQHGSVSLSDVSEPPAYMLTFQFLHCISSFT